MENKWLQAGIQAAQHQDLPTARGLLTSYVESYPGDEEGWLWLSRVADNPQVKKEHLKRVLELNPNNRAALAGLLTASRAAPVQPAAALVKSRRPALAQILRIGFFAVAGGLFFLVAAAMLPMFMGDRTLVILSGSMEPNIHTGAAVVAQPVPSVGLQVGDVIVFSPSQDAQLPIVHRIVSIQDKKGTRYYTTRGDANKETDTAEISLPATAWRVWYNVPVAGQIIYFASSAWGIVSMVFVPIAGLAALAAVDWLKRKRPSLLPASLSGRAAI